MAARENNIMSENIITISRIELVSPRRKIYALYNGEELLCELSENTLVHFGLYRGTAVSGERYREIVAYQEFDDALQQALRYLQNRPHLRGELAEKLRHKQFRREVIEKVLIHLQRKNYLNDGEYTRMFINEALRAGKTGPLRLRQKLVQKGAATELIDEALTRYDDELQFSVCKRLAEKKLATLSLSAKNDRYKKLSAFLAQKGFYHETIRAVLDALL